MYNVHCLYNYVSGKASTIYFGNFRALLIFKRYLNDGNLDFQVCGRLFRVTKSALVTFFFQVASKPDATYTVRYESHKSTLTRLATNF